MKNRLKIIITIAVFFILYVRVAYLFLRTNFSNEYTLKNENYEFKIIEIYKESSLDNLKKGYLFNIEVDNNVFEFQLYDNMNGYEKIIKKIYYYIDNDYSCIYPVFKDNIQHIDILCKQENYYIYYNSIEDKSQGLKDFTTSIKEYKNVSDNDEKIISENVIYNSNFKDYGIVTNYKGYYNLNTKNKKELFKRDIYDQKLSTFVNNYYIIADYNQTYEFDKIYVIDMLNDRQREIICYPKISFDSYIQGIVNNKIYIYDRINKKQHEIDVNKNTIHEVGNIDKGIKIYKNNTWIIESAANCTNSKILFDDIYMSDISSDIYKRIDKVGKELGYYYYYEKKDDYYNVYRSPLDNTNFKTFLFKTNTIEKILYINDTVYFIDNDILKCYNIKNGVINIFKWKEFIFNNSIIFGIYKK